MGEVIQIVAYKAGTIVVLRDKRSEYNGKRFVITGVDHRVFMHESTPYYDLQKVDDNSIELKHVIYRFVERED